MDLARIDAAELVAHADLLAGQWADAEAGAESILAVDPVREPAWEVLIRALGGAGRTAEAMRAAVALPPPSPRRASSQVLRCGWPKRTSWRPRSGGGDAAPPARSAETAVDPDGWPVDRARPCSKRSTTTASSRSSAGGVGKTRLAVDVAVTRADAHARGAILVELARVADASGVASTIAAALDLRPTPGRGSLRSSVSARSTPSSCSTTASTSSMLIVAVVPAMLADGDHLRVLATSREALAIDGEHVISLGPLATAGTDAPAIQLFRQRARLRVPRTVTTTHRAHSTTTWCATSWAASTACPWRWRWPPPDSGR